MLLGTASMLFVACGGGDTSELTTTETPTTTKIPTTTKTPTTTETPATTTAPITTEKPLPPQTDPISQEGLMLWYDFENGQANDVSGNDRSGSVYGTMDTVSGVWGDALFFSGGYVDMPDLDFSNVQNFSV